MRHMHLYVATDGECFKIGISVNPKDRMRALGKGVRLLQHWRRPYAREVEMHVKSEFSDRLARSNDSEWFRVTQDEIMVFVIRVLRIFDYDAARDIEPPPIPLDQRRTFIPPFKLDWLSSQANVS